MLKYITLEGEVDKVQTAVNRLKAFEPAEGYYVAFSGGKDSQCIYHLCEMAGVKFDAHYNITSVDPPELVRFIKKYYPNVSRDYPRYSNGKVITMWNLIPKQLIPPMRNARYCCRYLKESSGKGRVTVTGVRWDESINRKNNQGVALISGKGKQVETGKSTYKISKQGGLVLNDDNDESRRIVENCYRTMKTLVNPIIDWTEEDVWEFLNDVVKVPHCELYDQGFNRLGCIGCPMGNKNGMEREFILYPNYKKIYLNAFKRIIDERTKKGIHSKNQSMDWKTPEEVMKWWIYGASKEEANLLEGDETYEID